MSEIYTCPLERYTCEGFDPRDWEGDPPDFTLIRQWERRTAMVCKDCNDGYHDYCSEKKRQFSDLNETEKAGSSRCDCQHQRRVLGRLLDAKAPL